MIHQKTVFIIGAGAGKDFAMPIGSELADQIHKGLTQTQKDGRGGYALCDMRIEETFRNNDSATAIKRKTAAEKIKNGVLLSR